MTPEHIHAVQSTWGKVLPIKAIAARLFCERLLETDPSLSCLFRGDMRQQGAKLIQVIDAAVNALSRLDRIGPLMQVIGRRYADRGVDDHHFGMVGDALLWTLDKGLGDEFTPEVRDAWATVYGELVAAMLDAAATTQPGHVLSVDQKDAA
jgi:hemoglobin-like flavoprotein